MTHDPILNAWLHGLGVGCLVIVMIWVAFGTHNPYSQANFPCAEDEALVYAPQFGPDRVGCMFIEDGKIAPEVWER